MDGLAECRRAGTCAKCGVCLRCYTHADCATVTVAEMAGLFEGGPDSVEWLREQRSR
jgi:hypothetical protein